MGTWEQRQIEGRGSRDPFVRACGRYFMASMCVLLTLLPLSCDLEDEDDKCCYGNMMTYRYILNSTDYFEDYIKTMRYFLFDGDGKFLQEMECYEGDLSKVDLSSLTAGDYSLVAVSNLYDYGTLSGYEEEGLEAFVLTVDDMYEESKSSGSVFNSGDPIYWGMADFTLIYGRQYTYVTDMANIHCILTVRVEWETLPAYSDGYTYELDGIGSWVDQHNAEADTIGVQHFPKVHDYDAKAHVDVPLRRFALQASIYTLRYTNTDIPTFRLLNNGVRQIPDINLLEVFTEWEWHPSNALVQVYEMLITIDEYGNATVSQGLEAYVGDWADGGTFT